MSNLDELKELLDVLDGPYGFRADIERLIEQETLKARIDELERSVEQTEMQRHENGFNVPYNYIEQRNKELKAQLTTNKSK